MKNIEKHLEYLKSAIGNELNIIEPKKQEDGSFSFPYVIWDEEARKLHDDFYASDILDTDYKNTLEISEIKPPLNNELLDSLDINVLKALLTHLVREERFSEGAFMRNIYSGDMYRVLNRINKLMR